MLNSSCSNDLYDYHGGIPKQFLRPLGGPCLPGKIRKVFQTVVCWTFYPACWVFIYLYFNGIINNRYDSTPRRGCVCVWGGGVGGWRGVVTSYIWHSTDVRALFQRCQEYDWPPFFNKKYMNGPIFLDSCVKGPIFLTSWYMHIFFAQRFFEAAYPLGITWIDCDIFVIIS